MTNQRQKIVFQIRQATESDEDAINAINRRAWSGGITTHELLEQRHGRLNNQDWRERITSAVGEHLARPDVTTFVAEHQGKVIGFAAAQIDQQPPAEMGTVSYNAVDPDYQRQGVGTALIEHVIAFLEAQGAHVLNVVTVETDEPVKHIYERLGFEKLTCLIYYSKDCQARGQGDS
jgi:ribosomal protein S18 acetylase RimI-like enzyme